MVENRKTVTVIEDDSSVREALHRLLHASGFEVNSFGSAEDYLAASKDCPDGCVVLDIRMLGLGGLGLFPRLRQSCPTCPVIFLTGHGDVPMAVRAMKEGAFEFLTKPVEEDVLVGAVERALVEHRRLRIHEREAMQARELVDMLTPREREVFRHVIAGSLNKEIAAVLGIAEQTVKIHRGHLTTKLGRDRVPDLVALAAWAGVEPGERDLQ